MILHTIISISGTMIGARVKDRAVCLTDRKKVAVFRAGNQGTVMNEEEYKEAFGLGKEPCPRKARCALRQALDNRKFEIDLYWRRAAYFWALIAATFAGYFTIGTTQDKFQAFNAFLLACLGFIFSLAWFLINKGSKYWQENWENHVDKLEDGISGPLYKTVLETQAENGNIFAPIEKASPFSVSRINQWVSLFVVFVWVVLILRICLDFDLEFRIPVQHAVIGLVTLSIAIRLFHTRSSHDKHRKSSVTVTRRKTFIVDE